MTSFTAHPSWTRYRDILDRRFSIRFDRQPVEQWRQIRGHSVRLDAWLPDGPARGVLILVHGGGGNGRILAPCALPALAAGWRVLAPDLPGYGLTRPAPGYRGDYAEWPAVVAELARTEPGPVVLMGLSMGGMTAVFAAKQSPAVAGVIATTLLDLSDPAAFVRAARWPWLGRLSLWTMRLAPWLFDRLVLPLGLATPLSAMSSDAEMQAYFRKDPLIGGRWVRARFFRTAHKHRADDLALTCPVQLVHPGADAWTPTAMSLRTFEALNADKRFVELSNGSHLPAERPAFQELSGAVIQFLDEVAGQR